MDLNLKGKSALVCGSTQGIGRACAFELAALGADIVLIARDQGRLKEVVSALPVSAGQHHGFLVADFSDREALKRIIADFISDRTIHILVNNTGGPPPGPAVDAKEEDFLSAFSSHLLCNQILAQTVLPGMKASGWLGRKDSQMPASGSVGTSTSPILMWLRPVA